MECIIKENKKLKILKSDICNYIFHKDNGLTVSWGRTTDEDPHPSPFGPWILDMEISTVCKRACSFCYKGNTANGTYMTLEQFKTIFDKLPKSLTQIAFGIGDIDGNPDLYKIMEYCREHEIAPNITINGDDLTQYHAKNLVKYCGAVAVSHYDTNTCLNAVKKLSDLGLKQVNIHKLLSRQTLGECHQLINRFSKSVVDSRWTGVNAVVFLWVKPKGPRNTYTPILPKDYKILVNKLINKNFAFGFDSCTAPFFLEAVEGTPYYKKLEQLAEPCESTLFSYYINTDGVGFPCSFTEDTKEFKGIDVLNCNNFIEDVWKHQETSGFREKCVKSVNKLGCRKCQAFNLEKF